MAGLRQFTISLEANQTAAVTVRGNFLYMKEAASRVLVSVREYDIGGRTGEAYELVMGQNEKLYAAQEFDNLTFTNQTAAAIQITFLAGYGDFAREVPAFTGSAAFLNTGSEAFTVTETPALIKDATAGRKSITIRAELPDATAYLEIADSLANLAADPFRLYDGESIKIESESAIYAQVVNLTNPSAVYWFEETYNA